MVDRNEQIAKMRREGTHSLGEIAKEFGLTRQGVKYITEKMGVDPKRATQAYRKRRVKTRSKVAQVESGTILLRYIGGEDVASIAKALGSTKIDVAKVVDDGGPEVLAARSSNLVARQFPGAAIGPRDDRPKRADRVWERDAVIEAVARYASERDGVLPATTDYDKEARRRDDLPSFGTVRNRVGRWSDVRVVVARHLAAK